MIKLIKSTFHKEKETKEKLANFILKTNTLSMGKECSQFEENFAKKQNRKYAVFVNSGSSANLILIQSLLNLGRLKRGQKIGISALTWSTNVMPIIQLGLVPILIDCELKTLNVSPKTLKKCKEKLNGLFITNALGFSDDIEKIKDICLEKNIIFMEDNCESLGSKVGSKLLGNFGIASTFSFFVGHHMSTIEGGMICTDDEEIYNALKITRAHGWARNLNDKKKKELEKKYKIDNFYSKYTFYDLGYCVRPTEINGFLGNIQIKYLDEIIKKREANFLTFNTAISQNKDLLPLELSHMNIISNFACPIIFKERKKYLEYRKKFEQNKIEIRPIIAGNIANQPFYKKYISKKTECKNADYIHKNGFYFGNNPDMTKKEIKIIVELIKNKS